MIPRQSRPDLVVARKGELMHTRIPTSENIPVVNNHFVHVVWLPEVYSPPSWLSLIFWSITGWTICKPNNRLHVLVSFRFVRCLEHFCLESEGLNVTWFLERVWVGGCVCFFVPSSHVRTRVPAWAQLLPMLLTPPSSVVTPSTALPAVAPPNVSLWTAGRPSATFSVKQKHEKERIVRPTTLFWLLVLQGQFHSVEASVFASHFACFPKMTLSESCNCKLWLKRCTSHQEDFHRYPIQPTQQEFPVVKTNAVFHDYVSWWKTCSRRKTAWMESCMCHRCCFHGGPPPPPPPPPLPLPPPPPPPCLAWECDGWLGRLAFTLTRRTCQL